MNEEQNNQNGQQAQPLTPEVALQNLAFASRQARLTYQEHAVVDASINLLARLVQESGGPAPLAAE